MALLDERRRTGSAPRPARGADRWERLSDAVFYGVAASVVLLVVVRELTGSTLPEGDARGVVLGACAVVTLVVAVIVLRRR